MQGITLLIKMTGLLLLVPNARNGAAPMHVLMPATGDSVPLHAPQIGFLSTKQECDFHYDRIEGVCYVDISGWYIEIGQLQLGGSPQPPTAWGAADVSDAAHRINRARLGPNPGRSVTASITLNNGRFAEQCRSYRWTWGSVSNALLSHTVTWTMVLSEPTLRLRRKPLDAADGDPPEQEIVTLAPPPDSSELQLFIRNAPASLVAVHDTAETLTETQRPDSTYRATHFHAFYDFIGVQQANRNIPYSPKEHEVCQWPLNKELVVSDTAKMFTHMTVAGMMSCMVASGLPVNP